MRPALLPAILLAACTMSGAAQAGSADLTCPGSEDALTGRLCAAVGKELRRLNRESAGDQTALRLTLHAHSPRPDLLRARLTVEEGGARREGPELELTVTDRAAISDRQIQQLARLLLDQTLSHPK
ncbi:hypothetical protein [Paracoccus aminovorans]|uniref:hypothetical protein n=1 Tax=Paracoccus aminovorans TaxID=34004 RepID=UPI002B26294B|nr:hypothetical protein [Paracoccus aminovorans]